MAVMDLLIKGLLISLLVLFEISWLDVCLPTGMTLLWPMPGLPGSKIPMQRRSGLGTRRRRIIAGLGGSKTPSLWQ